jgi:hypothetical protein
MPPAALKNLSFRIAKRGRGSLKTGASALFAYEALDREGFGLHLFCPADNVGSHFVSQ